MSEFYSIHFHLLITSGKKQLKFNPFFIDAENFEKYRSVNVFAIQ